MLSNTRSQNHSVSLRVTNHEQRIYTNTTEKNSKFTTSSGTWVHRCCQWHRWCAPAAIHGQNRAACCHHRANNIKMATVNQYCILGLWACIHQNKITQFRRNLKIHTDRHFHAQMPKKSYRKLCGGAPVTKSWHYSKNKTVWLKCFISINESQEWLGKR